MATPLADLYRAARERTRAGERVAMTTVVATSGSTPQKAGAHMLIFADGAMMGTIGGGCIEAEVWSEAKRLMKRDQSALRSFTLADDPDQPGGDVCGGTMHVFIDVLRPDSPLRRTAGDVPRDPLQA
jgi:xanthine dehydrogenase accessory factor